MREPVGVPDGHTGGLDTDEAMDRMARIAPTGALHVSADATNDLVRMLREKIRLELHRSPLEAARAANPGDGVLVLADSYPESPVTVTDDFYQSLRRKKVPAYVEFPARIPDCRLAELRSGGVERAVVSSDFFQGLPERLAILGINGLHYLSTEVADARVHLVAARVAGFDRALYGLPDVRRPLLFERPEWNLLVATTTLSRLLSGRYAPMREWSGLWLGILRYLLGSAPLERLEWEALVRPTYGQDGPLPPDAQVRSVERAISWYRKAHMLIPASGREDRQRVVDAGEQKVAWAEVAPDGDGSKGVFECIFSEIDERGTQPIGIMERGDCVSETAMAFAAAGRLLERREDAQVAERLLDYYLLQSQAMTGEYGDPRHPAYGLIPWGISNRKWYTVNYGDDNARFLLAAWTAAALTRSDRWDEVLLRAVFALLRTTGRHGFRGNRLNLQELEQHGWQYYGNRDIVNLAPHFECYLWACYLWAFDKTGDPLLRERALAGIHTMMAGYPERWQWTNGLAQEKARMILPLAWLLRVDDSQHNRRLLLQLVEDLLALQQSCGAIREELGDTRMGRYPPPQSNAAYGTNEASLIARNGDPVSDLLYTTNFAFLGLHEAASATGDPAIGEAVDRLADFLCRIQVRADKHPEVDGGWMRAFDFKRFEHWGANADHGWGAWAIESGWTQGWITTILALRAMNTSIWELTRASGIGRHYPSVRQEMLG